MILKAIYYENPSYNNKIIITYEDDSDKNFWVNDFNTTIKTNIKFGTIDTATNIFTED